MHRTHRPEHPPERRPARGPRAGRGFTLIEAVVTLSVLAVVAGMLTVFIRPPLEAYVDSARRAELGDVADNALRRFERDVRSALPNSLRIATSGGIVYLEFLSTSGTGRYRSAAASAGVGDALDFSASDSSFEVLGSPPTVAAGAQLVVMNLGPGSGADAWAGNNRSAISGLAGGILSFASFLFPYDSPAHRFFVVDGPVSYACDPTGGTLTRYAGYAIAASQPQPPAVVGALVADQVIACAFSYDAVASRTGMVSVSLTLGSASESVRLFRQVAVSNSP